MSLLSSIIPTAYAAGSATTTAPHHQNSMLSTIVMLGVFFAIFYFLLIRPQSKRAKEQRNLVNNLQVNDEVMTAAGFMGKVKTIDDATLKLQIADNVEIQIQKNAVTSVLPQGTFKAV